MYSGEGNEVMTVLKKYKLTPLAKAAIKNIPGHIKMEVAVAWMRARNSRQTLDDIGTFMGFPIIAQYNRLAEHYEQLVDARRLPVTGGDTSYQHAKWVAFIQELLRFCEVLLDIYVRYYNKSKRYQQGVQVCQ